LSTVQPLRRSPIAPVQPRSGRLRRALGATERRRTRSTTSASNLSLATATLREKAIRNRAVPRQLAHQRRRFRARGERQRRGDEIVGDVCRSSRPEAADAARARLSVSRPRPIGRPQAPLSVSWPKTLLSSCRSCYSRLADLDRSSRRQRPIARPRLAATSSTDGILFAASCCSGLSRRRSKSGLVAAEMIKFPQPLKCTIARRSVQKRAAKCDLEPRSCLLSTTARSPVAGQRVDVDAYAVPRCARAERHRIASRRPDRGARSRAERAHGTEKMRDEPRLRRRKC